MEHAYCSVHIANILCNEIFHLWHPVPSRALEHCYGFGLYSKFFHSCNWGGGVIFTPLPVLTVVFGEPQQMPTGAPHPSTQHLLFFPLPFRVRQQVMMDAPGSAVDACWSVLSQWLVVEIGLSRSNHSCPLEANTAKKTAAPHTLTPTIVPTTSYMLKPDERELLWKSWL